MWAVGTIHQKTRAQILHSHITAVMENIRSATLLDTLAPLADVRKRSSKHDGCVRWTCKNMGRGVGVGWELNSKIDL